MVPQTYKVRMPHQNRKDILLVIILFCLSMMGCGEEDSSAPIIFSVTAEPDIVASGGISTVTVEAGDVDKDKLTYSWTASAGNIEGEGNVVTWSSPEAEGRYELTVTVSDGSDSVTDSIIVWVWNPRPGDYYPLRIGNNWSFEDNDGNIIEFEIVDTIDISGVEAFVKQMTTSKLPDAVNFSYIAKTSDAVYQHALGGSNAAGDTILFSPKLLLYKLPLIPGDKWEIEFEVKLPEGYYVGSGIATYEVVSEGDMTVKAGAFEHVFQVREDFTWELLGQEIDHIVTTHWLAPNVGIIKFTQEETVGGETIVTEAVLKSYLLE